MKVGAWLTVRVNLLRLGIFVIALLEAILSYNPALTSFRVLNILPKKHFFTSVGLNTWALSAKSRMPQFNDEEKAELERIINGEEETDLYNLLGQDELLDDDPYDMSAPHSNSPSSPPPPSKPSPPSRSPPRPSPTPPPRKAREASMPQGAKRTVVSGPNTQPKPPSTGGGGGEGMQASSSTKAIDEKDLIIAQLRRQLDEQALANNIAKLQMKVQQQESYSPPQPQQKSLPVSNPRPIMKPNLDWRNAYSGGTANEQIRPAIRPAAAVTIDDLDYDDFEAAMREEDNAGLGSFSGGDGASSARGKSSSPPVTRSAVERLTSGSLIAAEVWDTLKDSAGLAFSSAKFLEKTAAKEDMALVLCDPRRMNDQFSIVLSEFGRIPKGSLKMKILAINCDDVNDLRKFMKKNTALSTTILCDPSRLAMDRFKCRVQNSLAFALVLVDLSAGSVIKVWYEGDWDVGTTKDMIVEEVKAYRKNPVSYVQQQIGIR